MEVSHPMRPDANSDFALALAEAINAAPSVEQALAVTLQLFCRSGGWALGQVWFPRADGSVLTCGPVWHASTPAVQPFRDVSLGLAFTPGMPMVGKVWAEGQVLWAEDIGTDPNFRRADAAAALGLNTALLVPVLWDEQVSAVLEFLAYERRADDYKLRESVRSAGGRLSSLIARKRAETELRQSEATFRAVADSASDAIVSIDSAGVITYANGEAARMFGYEHGQLVGRLVTTFVPERTHHAHWQGMSKYLATGKSRLIGRTVTVSARRRDDSEFPVELSLATWEVQGAKYFSAIIRDVSERQRAQDELEAALAREREVAIRLQELDRLKNTLLDVVSHDLRSPLAAIRSIAAVLQRDAATQILSHEQRQSSLCGLEVSALKMRNLLDDLLDLERLAAGDTSLQRRMVDLAELTRSVVGEHAVMLASRDVRQDLEPVIAPVDPPKLERIVENLLVNASRHTPDGTPVRVSVRRRADSALICVDDSGPGVPADQRQVIFERFHQVAGSSRAGVGMGLSLVARLTELHGGSAWVEASASGGASFRVRLPMSSPP